MAVLGGGLAGLSAAVALAPRGCHVTLLEARDRLGGRASSFRDAATGDLVDNCQHVSMGCCTNFAHFCRTVGIDRFLKPQHTLYFLTPDRRLSRLRADPWPTPFHLARSFLAMHSLLPIDKLRIGLALAKLQCEPPHADPPFLDWLHRQRQSPRAIERFWSLVLVSALNETVDRIGLKYARKVFVDGFLGHRRGFQVHLPTVPLGRLYGDELRAWLERHRVEVRLNVGAKAVVVEDGRVARVELRDGTTITADHYVAALPHDRLLALLPASLVEREPIFADLRRLEFSPITSVHLWYDRPITRLPHAVLVDGVGQWLFARGESAPNEHYVQVVVSAAHALRSLGHDELERRIVAELDYYFPDARSARLRRSRVVSERHATFSAVPGVDRWRPRQQSPVANLFLAGDWTDTGWPATMEGAVRSGYLAAEAILQRAGQNASLVQLDLAHREAIRKALFL